MQVVIRQAGDATIVDVAGDIDLYNSPEMRRVLLEELKVKKTPKLLVNLTKVPYLDSSGVASLVEALKVARERNCRLVLYGLSPAAKGVLELSRLITVFECHGSEQEALSAVN